MKPVRLKEKSPEFDENKVKPKTKPCGIQGCMESGDFRAPKDRSLDEYYHFCAKHVGDYNRAWNFFDGMSDADVQDQVYKSMFGDRPTWKFTGDIDLEGEIHRQANSFYGDAEKVRKKKKEEKKNRNIATNTPEGEALEIMGLTAPITLEEIKVTYKQLAKKHHPDLNRNCPDSEERLKNINMSYTVLRLAYQKFEESAKKFS